MQHVNISSILDIIFKVLVSLPQLVGRMHNICKVRGSNHGHHKKRYYILKEN